MKADIGQKIKELRISKGFTLKELSRRSDLSISFLSQVERGLASIAVTSLEKITYYLLDLSYFYPSTKTSKSVMQL